MYRKTLVLFFLISAVLPAEAQYRSLNDIFPNIPGVLRDLVFHPGGLIAAYPASFGLQLKPVPASGIQISTPVLERDPAFFVESLTVVPYGNKPADLLTVYNALGKVRGLKGALYHSSSKNEGVPLFEDATRLEGARKLSPVPDPPDAPVLPYSETMYLRLKDVNFGNCYYRSDIAVSSRGLICTLTNFKTLTYGIIPVIKENKFITRLYIEPLAEGLMIYGIAGVDVSNFIASQIDIPSAIKKRVEIIIGWLVDGVTSNG
jgi:hypothetical protein